MAERTNGRMTDYVGAALTMLIEIAPAFAVRNLDAMCAFYGKLLGLEATYKTPVYAVLRNGPVQMHLYPERDGKVAGQGSAYVFVHAVDDVYATAQAIAKIIHQISDQAYGLRDFLMEDPEGNRIGVAQRLPA
ncbi:MAG: VOC family protein [Planctomycetes bacterium]|nr:VOC family protein [Planctomycetota bacterium]MCW8135268.1 VOC family protein [Planctomycetota bacterium]